MKKRIMAIVLVCLLITAAAGITVHATAGERTQDEPNEAVETATAGEKVQQEPEGTAGQAAFEVRVPQEIDPENWDIHAYAKKIAEGKRSISEQETLEVPVYGEYDLILNACLGGFYLGMDFADRENLNCAETATSNVLYTYPDPAIRERDEDSVYLMYDTDTGYRLYLFLSDAINGMWTPAGLPLVVKEMHSYADFAGIEVGDSIEEVEAIDSIASMNKYQNHVVHDLNKTAYDNRIAYGTPVNSIHYLTDGILKIEYEMLDNGDIVVYRIIYSEDYILPDSLGRPVNFKVLDADLPAQG